MGLKQIAKDKREELRQTGGQKGSWQVAEKARPPKNVRPEHAQSPRAAPQVQPRHVQSTHTLP